MIRIFNNSILKTLDKEMDQNEILMPQDLELEICSIVAKCTNIILIITNSEGNVLWVNDAFKQTMQYSLGEIVEKKLYEFILGQDSNPETAINITTAIQNQKPFKEEIIQYKKNNNPIWILIDGQPVFDEQNRLIKYVIIETDITPQKQQQEKLYQTELALNAFFNSSGSILILIDNSINVLAFNKKAETVIKNQLKNNLQVGASFLLAVPEKSRDQVKYFVSEALKGNATENREVKMRDANKWWNTKYLPMFDKLGNIIGASFTAFDITDRKQTESKLIENEQRYNLVTKATFDAIWDWDVVNNKLYRGEGFSTLFGYELDGLKNDPTNWDDLIHPEDLGKVNQSFKKFFESNLTNWTEEYRYLKSDGTYTFVRDKAIIIRDSEQKVVRVVGAMQDIGDQKLREQQLTLLESVITNTSDAIVITDALSATSTGSKIIYINEAFTKMTGYQLEDVLGKTPRLLQGPMTNRNEIVRLKSAIEKWEHCEIETINYKKNGDPFWVSLSIVPVANENAEYTHWIAIQKDVTERRKEMEEREQMIHELTKNNHELKQFSFITSHNLRAPLTNMIGILNLIDSSASSDHRMKRLVDGLKESTVNLNDTLNDLIKILIIKENSHLELEKIYFDNILNKVIDSIQNTIDFSSTVINSNFEAAEYVFFSKVYLESIFFNLITNAIKYKIPGIAPQINIYSTNTIDGIQLHISDNGLGMDWQKVKNKIFGLYQKFHNNKDSKGIGLYLVHAQITALGGTIELNTELNKGSDFVITFKKGSA